MPQLVVREVDEQVVRKLEERADRHGVSIEEEHRRILREALLTPASQKASFKETLLAMPNVGTDEDFARSKSPSRKVKIKYRKGTHAVGSAGRVITGEQVRTCS